MNGWTWGIDMFISCDANQTKQQAGEAGTPEDEKQKMIEKLQQENKDMKDRVLRTLAEMENVRTIARRYVISDVGVTRGKPGLGVDRPTWANAHACMNACMP